MKVFVNNLEKNLEQQESISGLLDLVGSGNQKGIAVAVNDQVVPKSQWSGRFLNENDRITIIRASQGG